MKLMLFSMALIFAVGFLMGGRLGGLSTIKLHWPGLAVVGLALQFVTGPGDTVPLVSLYVSFVLLSIFALRNIRVAGFPLIILGVAMNFLVIGSNQGMPVARGALEGSGQGDLLGDLVNNPYPKHHLADDGDAVVFLGDVIPVPKPIGQAISIGDIFTYTGVGVVVVSAMRTPVPGRKDDEEPVGARQDGTVAAGS
jgi:hypothetical protein